MLANAAFAGSATWYLNSTSNDWNTAASWTPETVPEVSTDVATFDVSNITDVAISFWPTMPLGQITFNPGASAYVLGGNHLDLYDAGIINNSGITHSYSSGLVLSRDGHGWRWDDLHRQLAAVWISSWFL